jgi:drug/metabolite transporter (DMT)-like permease
VSQLLLVALGLTGAALVSISQISSSSFFGVLLSLCAAFVWACTGLFHERYLVHVPLLPKVCTKNIILCSYFQNTQKTRLVCNRLGACFLCVALWLCVNLSFSPLFST